jgi:hypothetical protein
MNLTVLKTSPKQAVHRLIQTHNYMRFTLLTQVALLTLSVAIIFLFIKPAFTEIKTIQDDLLVYSDAVAKAEDYNKQLQQLLATRDSFSANDLTKLERFIPSAIDTLVIMHEIESIFASNNIKVSSLSATEQLESASEVYAEGEVPLESPEPSVTTQDFVVAFTGNYDALKRMLGALEANVRLLEVIAVQYGTAPDEPEADGTATALKTDDLLFTISLRAYALQAPIVSTPTL